MAQWCELFYFIYFFFWNKILLVLTFTYFFYGGYEVLVAYDCERNEQVEGGDDVENDGSIFSLFLREEVFREIVDGWRGTIVTYKRKIGSKTA